MTESSSGTGTRITSCLQSNAIVMTKNKELICVMTYHWNLTRDNDGERTCNFQLRQFVMFFLIAFLLLHFVLA